MSSIAVVVISTSISLLVGWLFFYTLWREHRIDVFRQRTFALRDALFDMAHRGEIPFRHPAYGLTRTMMNGSIRFAHRLRFFNMLALGWSLNRDKAVTDLANSFSERWAGATEELPSDARKSIGVLVREMNLEATKLIVMTSLPLFLLLFPTAAIALASVLSRFATAGIRRTWHRWVDLLDSVALNEGEIALEA